jgi:MFS transporter, PAT family, beta-lactamase induction signal transducer AmpG
MTKGVTRNPKGTPPKDWMDPVKAYFSLKVLRIVALGFASGLPLLLTMSTLSYWFSKIGVSKESIGLFALSTMPYSLKPLWAPLVDHMPIPFLTKKLGRRRSWLLVSQVFLLLSIVGLGYSNPQENIWLAGLMSFCVTFWSATQDIVIDGYRIETLESEEQTMGGVVLVFGYRMAMLTSGAGALFLSDHFNWEMVYTIMASIVFLCIIVTLTMPEPARHSKAVKHNSAAEWIIHSFWHPLRDFVTRPNWFPILLFILLYQAGDQLVSRMSMAFYNEMGYTGAEIATASKVVGLWVTIFGSLLGGFLAARLKILNLLFWAGGIHALTNLLMSVVAMKGHSMFWLYIAIICENFSYGIISAAFIGFISQLCNKEFSATQYALFSSLTAVSRIGLQSASGFIATAVNSWPIFFLICVAAAVPGLLVLGYLKKQHVLEK